MKEASLPKKWLKESEVAAITGLSVSTLQKMRHFRHGPNYTKIGRCVRYADADVDAYMAAHQIELDQ